MKTERKKDRVKTQEKKLSKKRRLYRKRRKKKKRTLTSSKRGQHRDSSYHSETGLVPQNMKHT
jgi:hypothetical protein